MTCSMTLRETMLQKLLDDKTALPDAAARGRRYLPRQDDKPRAYGGPSWRCVEMQMMLRSFSKVLAASSLALVASVPAIAQTQPAASALPTVTPADGRRRDASRRLRRKSLALQDRTPADPRRAGRLEQRRRNGDAGFQPLQPLPGSRPAELHGEPRRPRGRESIRPRGATSAPRGS